MLNQIEKWWSLTGSNRRHPACKAGALPAELRPHSWGSRAKGPPTGGKCLQGSSPVRVQENLTEPVVVGPGRLELPTSRLSGVRSNQLSYGPPGFRPDRNLLTDNAVSQAQHPDELGIGVNSRLAGTLLSRSTHRAAKATDKSNRQRLCVKKEKRRRRSSAVFGKLD